MKINNLIKVTQILLLSLSFLNTANAASIVVVAPTASTAGSFQITGDISFTITNAGSVNRIIFDEWVADDGALNSSTLSPNLSYSLNGNAVQSTTGGNLLRDNHATGNNITVNDGYLAFGNLSLALGDTFTLKAGTYSLSAVSGFNPQANQTFTGNLFLLTSSLVKASDTVNLAAVPEPTTYALLGMGALALSLARRRKA